MFGLIKDLTSPFVAAANLALEPVIQTAKFAADCADELVQPAREMARDIAEEIDDITDSLR